MLWLVGTIIAASSSKLAVCGGVRSVVDGHQRLLSCHGEQLVRPAEKEAEPMTNQISTQPSDPTPQDKPPESVIKTLTIVWAIYLVVVTIYIGGVLSLIFFLGSFDCECGTSLL